VARTVETRWISVLFLGPQGDGEALLEALDGAVGGVRCVDGFRVADPPIDDLLAVMEAVRECDVIVTARPLGRWGMFLLGLAMAEHKVVIEFADKLRKLDHPLVLHYEDKPAGVLRVTHRAATIVSLVSTWNRECHGGQDLAERILRRSHAAGMLGGAARYFDELVPDLAAEACAADLEGDTDADADAEVA
jgi:hypothetical protein